MFTPSKYQEAIRDEFLNGRGDLVVNATAGSGKTTLLVWLSQFIPAGQKALFLAFNKHNAEALQKKMDNAECRTIHSLGFSALRKVKYRLPQVYGMKYFSIVEDLIKYDRELSKRSQEEAEELRRGALEIVNLGRASLVNFSNDNELVDLCEHFGIEYSEDGAEFWLASEAIKIGIDDWLERTSFDFTDMIYLPIALNYSLPDKYDIVMVDECQDLSPCQLEVVMKARANGGRMIFVGDVNQSIMAFAGADNNSVNNIITKTRAKQLPLSICYRCPESHIELAKQLVPEIEARPGAPKGTIEYIPNDNVSSMVGSGDLIICRVTAPLITLALELIADGVQARVRGRDISEGLVKIINKVAKTRGYTFDGFGYYLTQYKDDQIQKLSQKRNPDAAINRLNDQIAAIEAIYVGRSFCNEKELIAYLKNMFSDDTAAVWLSTVHRAKGLEADRVFILKPEKMPLVWKNQQEYELQQEYHLMFVAYTRATQALYFVLSDQ